MQLPAANTFGLRIEINIDIKLWDGTWLNLVTEKNTAGGQTLKIRGVPFSIQVQPEAYNSISIPLPSPVCEVKDLYKDEC